MLGATLVAVAFVLPSFLMVLALSAFYVAYDGLAWMQGAFYGIGAAVIAIIARSVYKLTRTNHFMRPDHVEVQRVRARPRLADTVAPQRGAGGRGREEHADVTRVRPPRQHRAQPRDGARELAVVRASTAGASRSTAAPTPTSRPRRVVGGVRVVEVGARAEPGQQPVEGLLQRAAPAGGVERLDPDARTAVVVRERGVDLGVAVMVGARRAEPAVGARVVAVELRRATGSPSRAPVLLVDAAQQAVALVPLVQRPEERRLAERAAHAVVVGAGSVPRARRLEQRRTAAGSGS